MLNEIDLSRADLNLLVVFEVVLEQRHVGKAAQKLNLTPSAVSHALKRLRRLFNDPLFLRTPKGVAPTARAMDLAEPITDILARIGRVVSTAVPFEPSNSSRRFTIGAPDGVSAVFLSPLLARLRSKGPNINIGIRQVLPPAGARSVAHAWAPALADLEAGALDIAVTPLAEIPARFATKVLYEEDFVVAMRSGHAFASRPSLQRFCQQQHLVVSLAGDAFGFVDDELAKHGHMRRVAVTVPNFMMALAVIAETDLIAALPRNFVTAHAVRFGVVSSAVPVPLPRFEIRIIASKAAMMDAGVAWLFATLAEASPVHAALNKRRGRA